MQVGILRLDVFKPDMAVGTIEREMFAQKELQACPPHGRRTDVASY